MLNRKSALDELRKFEKPLRAKMDAMLEGQNMVMTHDSWTDSGNRTHVSATYTFSTEDWELQNTKFAEEPIKDEVFGTD